MAYLGNTPARSFISFEKQVFTIVNSQTAYTLSHSVNNENDIRLVINNIVQEPGSGKAYTASGTTLTLSAALTNGTDEMYCVFLGRATATNAPGAGSVNTAAIAADAITEAKIADDAVESEHLNNNVISGQTALGAEPADTDEFLVSDAGTIKRVDYSYIKSGTMTPAFSAYATGIQTLTDATLTKVTFTGEEYDTASAYDTSTSRFTVPSGQAGKYHFDMRINGKTDPSRLQYVGLYIYKNGSAVAQNFIDPRNAGFGLQFSVHSSVDLSLAESDYLEVYGLVDPEGNATYTTKIDPNGNTYTNIFTGFKIIE